MKVNLLEYLDKLEATVNAATPGDWTRSPEASGLSELYEVNCPYGEANPVADCMVKVDADHMVATQPKAMCALIAKLRELHDIVQNNAVGGVPFGWAQIEVSE